MAARRCPLCAAPAQQIYTPERRFTTNDVSSQCPGVCHGAVNPPIACPDPVNAGPIVNPPPSSGIQQDLNAVSLPVHGAGPLTLHFRKIMTGDINVSPQSMDCRASMSAIISSRMISAISLAACASRLCRCGFFWFLDQPVSLTQVLGRDNGLAVTLVIVS